MRKKTKKGPRRATLVRLDEEIYRAVKLRSAATGMSVSDQVDAALRQSLKRDERDIRIFEERANQPRMPYDEFIADLKKRGEI